MIVTYLRSSSINSLDTCEHQYYLSYNLGLYSTANLKAEKGNVVHKALELLAHHKLTIQQNKTKFKEDCTGEFDVTTNTEKDYINAAYEYYVPRSTFKWTKKDHKDCSDWTHLFRTMNGGEFDPLNRDIVSPEIQFDIPIAAKWASFKYKGVDGQLAIKGTLDLTTKLTDNLYELLDYKSGEHRKDWNTGEIKDLKKLSKDVQLLLYFYAAKQLFPDKEILLTILFPRAGGAFTPPIDYQEAEDMIKAKFRKIASIQEPRLTKTWKCTKFCYFGKNNFIKDNKDTSQTICEHIHSSVKKLGMDKTTELYKRPGFDVTAYGTGGGREA